MGELGQLLEADVLLEVVVDELHQALERRVALGQLRAADVVAEQAEQLAGDDPRVMLLHRGQRLLALGLVADQAEQVGEAFELLQLVARGEAHAVGRALPVVVVAGALDQLARQLDDELLAVVGIGQVDRIVGVDQQQLTGREVVFLAATAPQAVTLQQHLQMVDGLQRWRGDAHAATVADATQIETGETAMAEAGGRAAAAGQANAVRAYMLVDVVGYRIGVGIGEQPTLLVQQATVHDSRRSYHCYLIGEY